MLSKKGVLGGFISMFVATVVIVVILIIFIVVSGIVKEIVRSEDNFGVQGEGDVGLEGFLKDEQFDDITKLRSYLNYRFDDMVQLRIIVETGGRWEDWIKEEMENEK